MVRGRELAVLGRDHESLWNEVEVLRPLGMLQTLDVLVQPVLSGQLVRSGNARMSFVLICTVALFLPSLLKPLVISHEVIKSSVPNLIEENSE